MTFTTGKDKPQLLDYSYTETDTHYIFKYTISDPGNTLFFARLEFDRESITLDKASTVYYLEKTRVKTKEFTITFTYNLGAVPNSTGDEVFEVQEYVEPVQPPVTPVEKKKCGKKSSEIIIAALCAISVVALVQKKKH